MWGGCLLECFIIFRQSVNFVIIDFKIAVSLGCSVFPEKDASVSYLENMSLDVRIAESSRGRPSWNLAVPTPGLTTCL